MIVIFKKQLRDYIGVVLGSFILAFGLQILLIPNKIVQGGVSGLSTVLHYLTGLPTGTLMLCLDIPLFLLGAKLLGAGFGVKSFLGAIVTALSVDLIAYFNFFPHVTDNLLLAAIYGGIIAGLGLGIVFRCNASTGGSDLAAQICNHYFNISVGKAILIIDFCIIALAALFFGVEKAMIGLISLFVTTKVVDFIMEGVSYVRSAMIISDYPAEIAQAILGEMQRGVTSLPGKGLYTQTDKEVLFCVINRQELNRLKRIVSAVDQKAFVIITDAYEVLGEGFKPFRAKKGG